MAVSLGRSSGATLLGRPLDVSIKLEFDSADAGISQCVEADVFYADDRIAGSRVQASLERTTSVQEARIRIRVARPVDEPVVTLYVRAGCVQRTERRYVLLADVPTDTTPAPKAVDALSRVPLDARLVDGIAAPPVNRRVPEAVRAKPLADPAPSSKVLEAPRVNRRAAPLPPSKPSARLRLEPIDLSVEAVPQLRSSAEMLSLPAASSEQRTLAAALWKALSSQPEDVLAWEAKYSAIEADVRSLQIETRKNQAVLLAFSAELETARRERYANGLVYGLLVALVVALAGLAWCWRRLTLRGLRVADDKPWWRSKVPADTGWHSDLGLVASGHPPHVDRDVAIPAASGEKLARVDPQTSARSGDGRRGASSRAMPLSRRDQTDFGLSMPHTPRAAKAEELFDVQHQAEFFASIGKEEQAIAILRDHIGDDVQTSALIYLDLLNLYHRVNRKEDYEELADSFKSTFNAGIPKFEAYTRKGRGLESYIATLARIRRAWPRPAVLTLMESLIFLRPGEQGEPFDPEAFHELLVLYGIAREIVDAQSLVVDSLLDFDLPAAIESDPAPASLMNRLPVTTPDALPVIEDPLAVSGVPDRGLDIDLSVMMDPDLAPAAAGPQAAMPVAALEDELPPITGGNFIDFEALTVESAAAKVIKGGASRH